MFPLTDTHRSDPWNRATTRELMVTVFYPAADIRGHLRAPQLTPIAASIFKELDAGLLHPELAVSGVDWAATLTHSYVDAPALPGRHPVLLYSPGGADPRTIGTSLAEDLASHGYVVITIDHPGETSEVDFPGRPPRTIELPPDGPTNPAILRTMLTTRFADITFVLDQLHDLASTSPRQLSTSPEAALPCGLGRALDLGRIGIYGHSAGGATAAESLHHDHRLKAAANLEGYLDYLDGELFQIAQHGTRKPLLLAGTDGYRNTRFDRTWSAVMSHGGPVRRTQISHANHWIWTDYAAFAPQLVAAGLTTPTARQHLTGTNPHAIPAVRTQIRTFFNHTL
jgi:dienelactone hydrolase